MFDNFQDPRIKAYLAKRAQAEQGVKDAQDQQEMVQYAGVAGKLLDQYASGNQEPVIYRNKLSDLGSAPKIQKIERPEYDNSAAERMAADKVKGAQAGVGAVDQDFERAGALAKDDASSPDSAAAREYLKVLSPSAAQNPAFANLSYNQVHKIANQLGSREEFERSMNQKNAHFNAGMKLDRDKFDYQQKIDKDRLDVEREKNKNKGASKPSAGLRDNIALKEQYNKDTKDWRKDFEVSQRMGSFVDSASSGNPEAVAQLQYLAARLSNGPGVLTEGDLRNAGVNQAWVDRFKSWVSKGAVGEVTDQELDAYRRIGEATANRSSSMIQEIQNNYRQEAEQFGLRPDFVSIGTPAAASGKSPGQAPTSAPTNKPAWAN